MSVNLRFCFVFLILAFSSSVFSISSEVHIPEKYSVVEAGERFYFEVSIKYPENPQRKDLRIEYQILDDQENLVSQSKILKAIETQISFVDFLLIPENALNGQHTLRVFIRDYEGLNEEILTTFEISNNFHDEFKIYFFILVGVILFVGILIAASIFWSKRSLKKN